MSTLKSCDTCAYQQGRGEFARCARAGMYCSTVRMFAARLRDHCDENFSGWVEKAPPPPKRSLRQWLYDTFLK